MPWLYCFAGFIVFRFFALLFFSILNDLIFAYNIFITIIWVLIIPASIYGWLTVYSLYVELADLTKLEDLAHLRVSLSLQSLSKTFLTHSFRFELSDGNDAVVKCLHYSLLGWITSCHTSFDLCEHHAHGHSNLLSVLKISRIEIFFINVKYLFLTEKDNQCPFFYCFF